MGIDLEVIDLLERVRVEKNITVADGCDDDEIDQVSDYLAEPDLGDLPVWMLITKGPILLSMPLLGFADCSGPEKSPPFHFQNAWKEHSEWRRRGWVPVGSDGCGNYFLYSVRKGFGDFYPVFFVDLLEDKRRPAFFVATNLFHFLVLALSGELEDLDDPFSRRRVLGQDPALRFVQSIALPEF